MKYPKRVTIIELENAPFRRALRGHRRVGALADAMRSQYHSNVRRRGRRRDGNGFAIASFEIINIEVLKGNCRTSVRPSDKTSMDVGILLNGVCDVNGVPLVNVERVER